MITPLIGSEYPKKVIPLIDSAQKSIDIVMYDWRWYPNQPGHPVQQFNNAIIRASNRGVRVSCVLNSAELVLPLQRLGIHARSLKNARTLHSKIVLIDCQTLIIGSHNLTRNAFCNNIESSVIVTLPEDQSRFAEFFSNLYGI